jgi:parallel beta-helix repeat protein
MVIALSCSMIAPAFATQDRKCDATRGDAAVTINNFGQVNDRIYRGGQPKGVHFRQLAVLGVKTVLDLRSDNVKILGDTVGRGQINIFNAGNGSEIAGNTILFSNVLYGVQIEGDNNVVMLNRILNSEEAGVFLISVDNNTINSNMINDAEFGVFVKEATNTVINNSIILNSLTQIFIEEEEEEPAAAGAFKAAKVSTSLGLMRVARP